MDAQRLGAPPAAAVEQRLVQPQAPHRVDADGVCLEQGFAPLDDGVPVTAQIRRDLLDGAAVAADLATHPPRCAGGDEPVGQGELVVGLGSRAHRAATVQAPPPALHPPQLGSAAEHRQIHVSDLVPVLEIGGPAAPRTRRSRSSSLDPHHQRLIGFIEHPQRVHIRQANKQLAPAHSIGLHRGSQARLASDTTDSVEPLSRSRGPPSALTPAGIRSVTLRSRTAPPRLVRGCLRRSQTGNPPMPNQPPKSPMRSGNAASAGPTKALDAPYSLV